ncbi:MAG: transcription antitermination factor NusB [Dokdonella sp.]|nr:MAG: transcription antitermination factor NusB [Dokdonella sp.]
MRRSLSTSAGARAAASPSPRRRAREFVLQGIYQWRVSGNDESAITTHLADSDGFEHADREFFSDLFRGILRDSLALQEQLQRFLDRPFAELSPVEAAILLAAAFELKNCPQTPYRVIINEAIELAKEFGGTDGHRYVNGVLDKLAAVVRPGEVGRRSMKPGRQH